ncbi:MAG: glutamate synthase subunit alpha, partial [Nocardioides sp.]
MPGHHAFPPPRFTRAPLAQGLYDPRHEHDACGVAFVANLSGEVDHGIVAKALTALRNLDHRGAAGAEPNSGDGAGILMQVPDAFLREEVDFELPPPGSYAVGTAFLPDDAEQAQKTRRRIEEIAAEEGLEVLGWREVPIESDLLGKTALGVMPVFSQLFLAGAGARVGGMALERLAFCLRKRAEREAEVYFPSLSSRTLVYKGMLTTEQLGHFYPDLTDERVASALAVVHSRFSTNTFPSWELAHPYRMLAHNGEINTLRGNRNWIRARELQLASPLFGEDIHKIRPLLRDDISDSASLDSILELLVLGGRSPAHAIS